MSLKVVTLHDEAIDGAIYGPNVFMTQSGAYQIGRETLMDIFDGFATLKGFWQGGEDCLLEIYQAAQRKDLFPLPAFGDPGNCQLVILPLVGGANGAQIVQAVNGPWIRTRLWHAVAAGPAQNYRIHLECSE